MEASSSNRLFTKEWHGYLFLILLTMPVFFFHLGRRDFWAPDEPRFAQMAREMMERGDWIVPYLNNEPYGEKPPLTFWLMSLFCYLGAGGQVTPFWARLLSGIAGFLGVLFVFWYVKRALASQWLALLSAMILASNFRYFWQSQYLMIDMSFAFLAFSAVFLLKEGIEKNRPSLSLASYILLGFACLSKGPLAFVIAFLAFVPYYGYMYFKKKEFLFTFYNPKEEDFPSSSAPLIKEKPFFTWRIHIIGFFLLFSIAFSWYAAILYQEGWDFFYFNIIVQNYKRFTGELGSHLRPWFYYFLHFPPDFMPWTLLLPGAFYIIWKEKKKNPLILWLIFWAASFWFFLNLSRAKFSKYLLPVYPC
ncbi:MAG: glycosyltransferase family 39 protein, partial [Planctomycetota bacterium]